MLFTLAVSINIVTENWTLLTCDLVVVEDTDQTPRFMAMACRVPCDTSVSPAMVVVAVMPKLTRL